jgi:Ca2+/H+ antiporter
MLGFSLWTHKDLFRGAEEQEETEREWSRSKAIIILLIANAFVALLSEFLVGTIESVRDSVGLTLQCR